MEVNANVDVYAVSLGFRNRAEMMALIYEASDSQEKAVAFTSWLLTDQTKVGLLKLLDPKRVEEINKGDQIEKSS